MGRGSIWQQLYARSESTEIFYRSFVGTAEPGIVESLSRVAARSGKRID